MLVDMHVYIYIIIIYIYVSHIVSHLFMSTSALKVHCPPWWSNYSVESQRHRGHLDSNRCGATAVARSPTSSAWSVPCRHAWDYFLSSDFNILQIFQQPQNMSLLHTSNWLNLMIFQQPPNTRNYSHTKIPKGPKEIELHFLQRHLVTPNDQLFWQDISLGKCLVCQTLCSSNPLFCIGLHTYWHSNLQRV